MKEEQLITNKIRNTLHTILLLLGMGGLLAFLGYQLAGITGLYFAMLSGGIFLWISPRLSPYLILRMQGARMLSYYEVPEVYRIVEELVNRANLPALPQLYLLPAGIMNAFTVGTQQRPVIAVSRQILQRLNLREIAGVLAHEIGHIKNQDVRLMSFANVVHRLTNFFSIFGQFLLLINFPLLLLGKITISWFAIFLLIAAPALSTLLQLALSRTREFNADLEAARLTGDPAGLADALRKLEYYNGGILRKFFFPGYSSDLPPVLLTHPKTEERVKRLHDLLDPKWRFPLDDSFFVHEMFSMI